MKKVQKRLLIIFASSVLIVATYTIWLPLPAKFLAAKDNIKKADCIVILSGDWFFGREGLAILLYKHGISDKIIRILEKENRGFSVMRQLLNSDTTQREAYIKYFTSNGAPLDSLILGEAVATSTFDELKAAKEIILRNNFKSVLIVTGDYHMRRALITARWLFRSSGIEIYNASAYSKNFNPSRWWIIEDDIKGIVLEYVSIAFYLTYHFMLGK